jgi:hypothetical protein
MRSNRESSERLQGGVRYGARKIEGERNSFSGLTEWRRGLDRGRFVFT